MIYSITLNVDAASAAEAKSLVLNSIPGITADSIQSIGGRIPAFKTDSHSFESEDLHNDANDDPTEQALKQRLDKMCRAHKR